MKLPDPENAHVPQRKITHYLLDVNHPSGRGKAIFFSHFGFTLDAWQQLADALQQHAHTHEVTKIENTPFGIRYVIEGMINSPDGRNPDVRSVWFIDTGDTISRFVTAYALEENSND